MFNNQQKKPFFYLSFHLHWGYRMHFCWYETYLDDGCDKLFNEVVS